jgi:hypothetical protein
MFCTLLYNRYSVKLEALADSEANGFVFIDILYIIDFVKFLSIKVQQLLQTISVKEYNRKNRSTITYILQLYLTIDRHCQYNLSFLIFDLGSYNLMFIDTKQRCLQ